MAADFPTRRSAFSRPPEPEPVKEAPQEEPTDSSSEIVERNSKGQFTKEMWTQERRQKQSEMVNRLIDEGRFGGKNGFGRKRAKTMTELVAEHAREQADTVIARLDGMLNQNRDKRLQLEAIREYSSAEEKAAKNIREEEKHYRDMAPEDLNSHLLEIMGDALGLDLSEMVIDGEVVEDQLLEEGEDA